MPITFKNGEEMLQKILSCRGLYNPKNGTYVFAYNEYDSIVVYNGIDRSKASELVEKAQSHGEYWGAFLGPGGYIYDAERANPHVSTNIEWCNAHYVGGWVLEEEWSIAYERQLSLDKLAAIEQNKDANGGHNLHMDFHSGSNYIWVRPHTQEDIDIINSCITTWNIAFEDDINQWLCLELTEEECIMTRLSEGIDYIQEFLADFGYNCNIQEGE